MHIFYIGVIILFVVTLIVVGVFMDDSGKEEV